MNGKLSFVPVLPDAYEGVFSVCDKLPDDGHKICFANILVAGEQSNTFSTINQDQGGCSDLSVMYLIDVS